MIRKLLLAAAAVAALAAGAVTGPSNADAGVRVVIGGHGQGSYGWRGHRSDFARRGHRNGFAWRGFGRRDHGYRSFRPNCRWKVRKVKVRYWAPHKNRWKTRNVFRRYRVCY